MLVIGAGPAGLRQPREPRRSAAPASTVLDERPESGGQFFKPLAPSHRADEPIDRQFRDGLALLDTVRAAGVTIVQEAQVWGAYARR